MSLRTPQVFSRAVIALLLGLSAAVQWAAAADDPVDRARVFFEKGDLRSAGIELKNALQGDPGNADARLLLGEMYLKLGNGAAAEKEIRRAQELGIPPSRWRVPLVKALILQGNFADALARLEGAVDLPPEEQAGIWAQRGYAQFGLGRADQAKESFDTALRLNPDEGTATIGLIRLALEAGDDARAAQLADERLARHPDDVDGLLIRSEILRKAGNTEEAAKGFARVIEIDPGNLRGFLGHATTMIGLQRYDEALKDLDAAEAVQPDVPMSEYLRGVIDFQNRQWDRAGEHLQKVLAAVPNHLQSKLILGVIRYAKNDFEIADEYLGTVVNAMPDNIQARKVLGATRIKMREPDKAVQALLPAAGTDDPQLLALLGSAYLLQGDRERGQAWLNRAVELAPDVAALRTQLALSLLAAGQADKAVAELQSAVDLGQDILQADVLLVLAHLKNGRIDEAIKASMNLEQRKPDNPISFNLTGLALLAKGDRKGAADRFNKALVVDPGFITAEINLARIDVASNELDVAAERYKRVLSQTPKHLDAMLGLAALAERRGDKDELVRWLEAAQDANPTATQPGLLLSRFYMTRGDYFKALTIAGDLASRLPGNASAQQMLARAQTLAGQVPNAIRTLDQLAAANPKDPQLPYLAGGAHWKGGNHQAAAESFRKAIALKPDFVDAQVALASVLLDASQYEPALDVAKGLQRDLPKSPLGFRIEGTILTQAGRHAEAISPLEQAVKLADDGDITRQLANAYTKVGRPRDAIKRLDDWLKTHGDDRPTMALLAIVYQADGQDTAALKLYERLYEGDKTSEALLNNMAWLYHKTGDPRAQEVARQAYEAAPNRPEIADTYGWILFNAGQREKGLSILQQAYLAYPTQAEIGYHVAVAMSAVGRNEEAVKILRKLLRDNPNMPQLEESKALLQKLGG
jgi:putative PEP-CTERM system TPR-repeat lipoprotein